MQTTEQIDKSNPKCPKPSCSKVCGPKPLKPTFICAVMFQLYIVVMDFNCWDPVAAKLLENAQILG